MPVATKTQIDEEMVMQHHEEEKAKKETEEKRRRTVFNAIEALADTVDEEKLLSLLDVLDTNSWKEVIEERFIGRICGYPTCEKEIIIKRAQKYKLDKNKQKVYENYADSEKFCSPICLQKSDYLQRQLAELPLWLTGERSAKRYDLTPSGLSSTQTRTTNGEKMLDEKVEFIPDNLLVQLNSLNLGQIDASDSDGDDDDAVDASTLGSDDKQFLSNVRSFITAKVPSSNVKNNTSKPSENIVQKKTDIKKMDKETMESKLEKLRTKFGKVPKEQQKKAPIIVEPHHDIAPSKTKKDGGIAKAEEVMERLRLWITPNSIQYIDQHAAATEPSTSSSEAHPTADGIPAQQFIEHFYSGILDPREYEKKKNKEAEIKTVKLPLVDSIDQHFRRVEIVVNGLKKAWISLVGQLKVAYPVNNAKNLISTFALNKDNCVIDPKNSDYFAAAILQMMTHCSNDLKELLAKDETFEYYRKYYELLQINFSFFDSKLSELIKSKRLELVGQIKEEEEEGDEMEC